MDNQSFHPLITFEWGFLIKKNVCFTFALILMLQFRAAISVDIEGKLILKENRPRIKKWQSDLLYRIVM